ncbi:MAG: redoxin family protein [Pirellulaceae bacterium]|nr:redoxin family protein [Pirellulaceae bacterium]
MMVKRLSVLLALFLSCGVCLGQDSAQEQDIGAKLTKIQREVSRVSRSVRARGLSAEERAAATEKLTAEVEKLFADFDFSKLDVEHLSLALKNTSHAPDVAVKIVARAQEISRTDKTLRGARALANIFQTQMRMREKPGPLVTVEDVFAHPGVGDLLASPSARDLLSLISRRKNLNDDIKAKLFAHGKTLTTITDFRSANAASQYFSQLAKISALTVEEREPLRLEILNNISKHVAANELSDDKKKPFDSVVAQLNSPLLIGKFIGYPAPPIDLMWSAGDNNVTSLDQLKGKVVVIDFWATWCGPCIGSFPQVRDMQAKYKDHDVVILGITAIQGNHHGEDANGKRKVTDTKGKPELEFELMAELMQQKDMTWDVGFASTKDYYSDYGVRGIPHVAIIDAEGKIRFNGLHPSRHAQIEKNVDDLLQEAGLKVPGKHKASDK